MHAFDGFVSVVEHVSPEMYVAWLSGIPALFLNVHLPGGAYTHALHPFVAHVALVHWVQQSAGEEAAPCPRTSPLPL